MNSTCLLIPVYNHPDCLKTVIDSLAEVDLHCIMVNDGSTASCSQGMRDIARDISWVSLVERAENGGKGAAVKTGMTEAARLGYTHVLQVDADGQHDIGDIPRLLSLSAEHPLAIISGAPRYHNAPRIRVYGRYLTHIWVWINTLSLDIKDSMCGFRVYPLESSLQIIRSNSVGDRMDFDPEILVRLHWMGVPVIQFRTDVSYPLDGISHFRSFQDNLLISWMHTRLFFGMLMRLPQIVQRRRLARD